MSKIEIAVEYDARVRSLLLRTSESARAMKEERKRDEKRLEDCARLRIVGQDVCFNVSFNVFEAFRFVISRPEAYRSWEAYEY